MLIRDDAPDDEIARWLEEDRLWSSYALCDLDPPHRAAARYYLASDAVDAPWPAGRRGWRLAFMPDPFSNVLVGGHPDAARAALAAAQLLPPDTVFMVPCAYPLGQDSDPTAPGPYLAALRERYRAQSPHLMLRMALPPAASPPVARPLDQGARLSLLQPSDAAELDALYDAEPYRAFTPAMLHNGVYYGVRQGGRLVAAAGTHIVSPRWSLAMIGNVYTAPLHRGRGYAQVTTAAVAHHLRALRGCRDVALNVVAANTPAVRAYQRVGFRAYTRFWEGQATLLTPPP